MPEAKASWRSFTLSCPRGYEGPFICEGEDNNNKEKIEEQQKEERKGKERRLLTYIIPLRHSSSDFDSSHPITIAITQSIKQEVNYWHITHHYCTVVCVGHPPIDLYACSLEDPVFVVVWPRFSWRRESASWNSSEIWYSRSLFVRHFPTIELAIPISLPSANRAVGIWNLLFHLPFPFLFLFS